MFKVIGITGGVGSGKSTVLSYLEEQYGAHIIKADDVAKKLMLSGTDCFKRIVEALGEDIVGLDGEFDRARLAARIFENSEERDIVDSIVHPAVKVDICESIEYYKELHEENCLVVIEAALLIEERYDLICDELWYVYADVAARIERLLATRGYTREKSLSIMKNQLSDAEMRSACAVVLDNSTSFDCTKLIIDREYERLMQA